MNTIAAFARLMLVCVCVALYLVVPEMLLGLAVWPVIWLLWQWIPPAERPSATFLLYLLPVCLTPQVVLDGLVPYLGDTLILVANIAIVRSLRRSKIPKAVALQR